MTLSMVKRVYYRAIEFFPGRLQKIVAVSSCVFGALCLLLPAEVMLGNRLTSLMGIEVQKAFHLFYLVGLFLLIAFYFNLLLKIRLVMSSL